MKQIVPPTAGLAVSLVLILWLGTGFAHPFALKCLANFRFKSVGLYSNLPAIVFSSLTLLLTGRTNPTTLRISLKSFFW